MSQVTHNQSGYVGSSMSVRAAAAYDGGEKPMSRWTKAEIIDAVSSYGAWDESDLKRFRKATLAGYFLRVSSWHHTGKYAAETTFYAPREDRCEERDMAALEERAADDAEEKAEKPQAEKVRISYEEWEGTRRHGRFERRSELGIMVGDWVYISTGKKRADGSHVLSIERFERAPRGTAAQFKAIAKRHRL